MARKLGTILVFLSFGTYLNGGGTVKGTVTFVGPVPRMKAIRMGADPICAAKHEEPARAEWLVAGENGELQNVFVYVKEGLGDGKFPVPQEHATIDQNGCTYHPH
ncbi:MAG: hypothetical protein ACE5GH_03485, partial [Fidelibacterota bacterium]